MEENREGVKKLDKRVDGIREVLRKRDDKVEKAVRETERRMDAEWREREAKRLNVVFHCIGEAEDRRATGSERQDWDRKSCVNIFKALKLNIGEDAIRFCRRVGEKKEEQRPMVVGFWAEGDKCLLLRNARHLEKTIFKEVTVGPDLTKKQRAEEAEMREEADRRNREELTEEDVSKNLKWTIMGDRVKKSLIKTVARERKGERGADWRRREDQGGQSRTLQKKGPGGTIVGGRYQRRGERVSETGKKRSTPERAAEKDREKVKATEVATESERESSSESEAESETEVEQMEAAEEDITIYLVYRSPNATVKAMAGLVDLVKNVKKNTIVIGDFNLPDIDWSTGEAARRSETFLDAVEDAMLVQLVEFATHIKGNCLDLVLSNIPERVSEVNGAGRLGSSDHEMLEILVQTGAYREVKRL
jgi:hypothetical protein